MQNLNEYSNNDGTYTSPKNGKTYKSLKAFRSHWNYKGHVDSNTFKERLYTVPCKHCNNDYNISGIKRHESACYLNPEVMVKCKVCDSPIKNYKHSKGTCSYSCSNVLFAHLRNPDKSVGYQTLCFRYHEKKCIVCGENKIVAVHHYDHDHSNNDVENLIPLCPTHHQYVHSRYKNEVQDIIDEYVNDRTNLRCT